MRYKLGKTEPTPEQVKLEFKSFLHPDKLPTPPTKLGHTDLLPFQIGMLANDQVGDCVVAGAAHETMIFAREGGASVNFTDASVLADYSEVTGYDPNDPGTDQGTNVTEFIRYRTHTGVRDGSNVRHKIAASLRLDHGHLDQYAQALFLFSAVGLGLQLPSSAQDQFAAGEPWTVVPGASIEGGHYVSLLGRVAVGMWLVATWGKLQQVTDEFLVKYSDEAYTYLSLEALGDDGKSLEGFDLAQLRSDLRALD